MTVPSPARLWWHVHPLTAVGAEPVALPADAPVRHRLPRLLRWLDHVVELGCDGLLLGPVFASSSHGYDTVTYDEVDSRLGDADDLTRMVEAAGERGVAVALDGVFNHVGRDFWAFRHVLEHGPDSPYASWFRLTWPEDGWRGPGSVPGYATFEGHDGLVALDHGEPAVRELVMGVLERWAAAGVTAWRLDAAYAVPSAFLHDVTTTARAERSGSWFLGEVIHGDYGQVAEASGLDAVTQYELWKATWSSLVDHNLYELAHALGRHAELFTGRAAPQTFLGNHDVTRIASQVADERHLPHAEAVLMTVAGVPSVYAGDEHGLHAVKEERLGGDDAIRPELPEDPLALQPEVPGTFARYRDLARLRRAHPWLETCRTDVVTLANEHLAYVSSPADGGGRPRLLVVLSLHDGPVELEVPDGAWTPVLGSASTSASSSSRTVRLEAHGWAVLTEG